jgi:hypothetical protein
MPDANVRRWGTGSPEPRTRAARGLTAGRLGRARFTKDDTATAVPNRIAILGFTHSDAAGTSASCLRLAAYAGSRGTGSPSLSSCPVHADQP